MMAVINRSELYCPKPGWALEAANRKSFIGSCRFALILLNAIINSWIEWCKQSCCNKLNTSILCFLALATLSSAGISRIRPRIIFIASVISSISSFSLSKLDRSSWNCVMKKKSLMPSCGLFMKWKSYLWQILIIMTNSHHVTFHLFAQFSQFIFGFFEFVECLLRYISILVIYCVILLRALLLLPWSDRGIGSWAIQLHGKWCYGDRCPNLSVLDRTRTLRCVNVFIARFKYDLL